ncbi:MAG: hypothetical protein U0796_22135 [Gemmatales bacterium]
MLLDLGIAEVELATHPTAPTRLRHRPALLPFHLSARLRIHQAEILSLLVQGYVPADDDTNYVYGERLGIADEQKMATHIGSPAWLVAVGESMKYSCLMATIGVMCQHG